MDLSQVERSEVVLDRVRRYRGMRASSHRELEGRGDIVDFQGDRLHAVAVLDQAPGVGMVRAERRGQDQRDVPLSQDVARLVLHSGLEPRIGHDLEPEGIPVEIGRLPRIADEHPNVVDAPKRHGIGGHHARLTKVPDRRG